MLLSSSLSLQKYPILLAIPLIAWAWVLLSGIPVLAERPNVVLVMTDDQGWGQTGYQGHPVLKTPHLDAMSEAGLRFNRFYAAAPVCSPTRASVLTGRSPVRCGVPQHGYALRKQEKTLAAALESVGYATGHFGKWHLNGLRGPGVPIFLEDSHHPGQFGFQTWLSVSNFFDLNPLMSRMGAFEEFSGDSSSIIVDQAMKFAEQQVALKRPFLAVIWDGSPHSPWMGTDKFLDQFSALDDKSRHHYAELAAFDAAVGQLRGKLRELKIADNTLIWYCSDNGGLKGIKPDTVGGLRGNKGSVWEGGLRVPGIIEWPKRIRPRVTGYPASTMDIFPTIGRILDLPKSVFGSIVDGQDLTPLLEKEIGLRAKPIPFRFQKRGAWIDNQWKLVATNVDKREYELFDLVTDPNESNNVANENPGRLEILRGAFESWNQSVERSVAGKDYPSGKVAVGEPMPQFWYEKSVYQPYLEDWSKRPEYQSRLKKLLRNNRK